MKTMNIISLAALSLVGMTATAQEVADVTASNVRLARNGKYLSVDMDVDVSKLDVKSNRAVVLTPTLVAGPDTLALSSVGIYGRQRYYYYLRNDGQAISGEDETAYRKSECPDVIAYHADVDYADWMNGALLNVDCSEYGCCNRALASSVVGDGTGVGRYKELMFAPKFHFVQPEAEAVKQYEESGTALVIFPCDQTTLYPNLAANESELGRIKNDINRIKDDKDVFGTSIYLKGYASPEGTYAHNTDLAAGRVQAVRTYLKNFYHLADNAVTAESEPENWGGLREYVENSTLTHRDEILAIIDQTDVEPDAREWKLKSTYPTEYATLLRDCYPSLRRTEYRIRYQVRGYTDIEEIKRIYNENPKKLNLNELYLLALSYDSGSDEFNDVFETAARLYPTDATANLNAANSELQRGDLKNAANHLERAGQTPEASYARGLLAALSADYATAAPLLRTAADAGIPEATDALNQLADGRLLP
jgi:outer membrane protein OmpA-like peptidoglycan-associated protein